MLQCDRDQSWPLKWWTLSKQLPGMSTNISRTNTNIASWKCALNITSSDQNIKHRAKSLQTGGKFTHLIVFKKLCVLFSNHRSPVLFSGILFAYPHLFNATTACNPCTITSPVTEACVNSGHSSHSCKKLIALPQLLNEFVKLKFRKWMTFLQHPNQLIRHNTCV